MQLRTHSRIGKFFISGLACLCAVAHAEPDNPDLAQGPDDIILVQSADLSGPSAYITRQFTAGATAYFAQLNARGGVHGRQVRLVSLDDRNAPEQARENTRQLLRTYQPLALFGYVSAKTSTAVLPIVNQHKIPFFAPVTGARVVYRSFNPYIFTIRASYREEFNYLISRIVQIGLRRVAVFNDTGDPLDRLLMQESISDAHGELVAFEKGLGVGIDEIADRLLQSKPQVIMFMTFSHGVNGTLLQTLRDKNYLGYFYCASLICSPLLTNQLQEKANGLIISQIVPFPWRSATPIVNEYHKSMRTARIKEISYLGLEGYIAAKTLAEGLKRAGAEPTREKLIAALESINDKNYSNAGFRINYSASNHHGSTYVDMTTVTKGGALAH